MNFLRKYSKAIIIILVVAIIAICILMAVKQQEKIVNVSRAIIATTQEQIPILAYHAFVPSALKMQGEFKGNKWIDDIEGFEEQMKYLSEEGWNTLSLDEFYLWYNGKLDVPPKSCVITFDDGYYEMYYTVLPILEKYGFSATCFVIGAYTPEITPEYKPEERHYIGWDKIKEIQNTYPNLQFESHSYNLHGMNSDGTQPWTTATFEELKADFEANDKFGFTFMAYPYGGYNDKMLDAVSQSNIKMAFTFNNDQYAAKIYPKYEIPRKRITAETTQEQFREIMNFSSKK
jgi:peptidoglycan/xylan/chitin deacetylase (PgdA/CDA1 family)